MIKPNKTSHLLNSALLCGLLGLSGTVAAKNTFPVINNHIQSINRHSLDTTNAIYTKAEVQPVPQGGIGGLYNFLSHTIHYPYTDRLNNIQGRVLAEFVVEKDGSLTDIKIMRAPSNTLGNETIRALKLSPKWTPGQINGQAVRVQYMIPVDYSLSNISPISNH